jgi:hypothetical protein
MSRTYRKTDYTESVTKETYVCKSIADWIKYPRRWKKRRLAKEVYEARIAEAQRDYEARVAANGGHTKYLSKDWLGRWDLHTIRCDYVSRWERYQVDVTREECINNAERDYDKFKRDGRWNETGVNTAFKKKVARDLRRNNNKICKRVLADDIDIDGTAMPSRKDGKARVWDFW